MIKFYEIKDKHYSGVFKQWSVNKIIYVVEDFNSNSERNIDLRKIVGDLIYDNLNHLLLYVKNVNPADRLRTVEARDICYQKLIPLCREHRYNTPKLMQEVKKYENEIRDLAVDSKSKIWRNEWETLTF